MENIISNIYSNKSVSTSPDECKDVGKEMSTFPKRKALEKSKEDMVSAPGDRGYTRVGRSSVHVLKIQELGYHKTKMMNS